ncbi:MAG: PolC-type DNA polymerase III [Gemmatimonadota bacterium]
MLRGVTPLDRRGALRDRACTCLAERPLPAELLVRRVFGFRRVEPHLAERLVGTLLNQDPGFERTDEGWWRLARFSLTGPPRPLSEIPFVVVDVETTGGYPVRDRIIEIAAVRVIGGRVVGEWSSLVDPGRSIPPFVARLTGIDDQTTARAPRFGEVADSFVEFLGGSAFVAHNAHFDWRFVNDELFWARGGRLTNARLCTIRLARRLLPGVRRRSLDALAYLLGVPVEGRHRALGDARATARILIRLIATAEDRGIVTEEDLAALAGWSGTLRPVPL